MANPPANPGPGAELSVMVWASGRRDSVIRGVAADDLRRFELDLAGESELLHNAVAYLRVSVGRTSYARRVSAPGLRLDLDAGRVSGFVLPGGSVTVTVRSGGTVIATRRTTSSATGYFESTLINADTGPAPLAGQEIEVMARRAEDSTVLLMVVPELTVELDAQLNVVRGRVSGGGVLGVRVAAGYPYWRLGTNNEGDSVAVASDGGSYSARFIPAVDIGAGWGADAKLWLPDGGIATRSNHLPIVNVEHGGAFVCGFGPASSGVTITASDAGGHVIGRVSGRAAPTGAFELVLRDGLGRPVPMVAGTTVAAVIGDAKLSVRLPDIDVGVDWRAGSLNGQGPPDTPWMVSMPVTGCFSLADRAGPGGYAHVGVTGADGAFSTGVGDYVVNHVPLFLRRPGESIEAAFVLADGNRVFRLERRPLGRVVVHTDRVRGLVGAFEDVVVTVSRAGVTVARAATRADYRGAFAASLGGGAAPGWAIEPGDRVTVETPGQSELIWVRDLSFDLSLDRGLYGLAPADTDVALEFGVADGQVLRYGRRSGADGRFTFLAADIPARDGWSLADATSIVASMKTAERHEILAEWRARVEPVRVYLPWTRRSRAVR